MAGKIVITRTGYDPELGNYPVRKPGCMVYIVSCERDGSSG